MCGDWSLALKSCHPELRKGLILVLLLLLLLPPPLPKSSKMRPPMPKAGTATKSIDLSFRRRSVFFQLRTSGLVLRLSKLVSRSRSSSELIDNRSYLDMTGWDEVVVVQSRRTTPRTVLRLRG